MWSAPKSAALANQFAEHPVLKNVLHDRWVSTNYWYWQCPGPWTWELVEIMHEEM
jgi:iron complex transport system substrate-binding protein